MQEAEGEAGKGTGGVVLMGQSNPTMRTRGPLGGKQGPISIS